MVVARWWMTTFQLTELFVSSLVHLTYGLYIFSTAVAGDFSQTLSNWLFKPNLETSLKIEDTKEATSAKDLLPIVLVHGIFGFGKGRLGGLSYFAGAEKKDERVLVPDLGSLTSIYDRARELFYYLKGGQVDYGEEHSKACGHSQFGRIYEQGYYPEWDEDHPIHFVGHSAGAQVVRVLQQMLADKAFKGYENTSENWVLSLTSLSGALNGTTRTYFDGMQPEDGKSLTPVCLLQLCRIGVIIYDWLDIPWLKDYYNFGFDHFSMSWRKSGIRGLVDCLLGNAGPFASGDWILPDLTIQGSIKLNSHLRTFPQTYYFSYATKWTTKIMGLTVPSGVLGIHPLLLIRVLQMSQWRHPQDVSPPYKGYRDEDWWDNDGALNTISMTHPRLPVEHPSQHVVKDSDCQRLQPGIWYYKIVEGDHILFVLNRERAGVQFDLIYDSIFERCRKHVGCDGSILLDTTPSGARVEKLAGTNGATVKGFELIDEIKAELERQCPGIVSCSDILVYLSRDAFVLSGLPNYNVLGGRRDGMESNEANVIGNLPLPGDTVDQMIDLFQKKGLNSEDLVVLIGAHSIGVAHCFNFLYRLDEPEKAKMLDPRLAGVMRFMCTNQMNTLPFDPTTQYKMDSIFYKQLMRKKGLIESDQILAQDIRTRGFVQKFGDDEMGWFDKFGKAMNKLGAIEVLTGNQGQIRRQCRAVN